VIPSHVEHQIDGRGHPLVLLYLDPETPGGRQVRLQSREPAVRPLTAHEVAAFRETVRAARASGIGAGRARGLHDALLAIAGLAREPGTPLDPRVVAAVRLLRAREGSRRSLASVAAAVGMSPRRFRQLFFEQLGISGRRYVLWLRIQDAVTAVGGGASLTEAAHAAGFADGAHLGRTFRQTLGIAPSAVAGSVFVMD
jgi:transcriptional regulator GlxA family with amidase domain